VFANELMTGWYNAGRANPISRITVASLADLGYQVNMAAADSYAPPASSYVASAAPAASWRYYSPFGVSDYPSLSGNSTDRLRAVDLIMEFQSTGFRI
jgi:hypothetical protein